jgi:TMEM175 potassium channel family protein
MAPLDLAFQLTPMPTSRLEAFSDGVFAIAATLLILNVGVAEGPLREQLLKIWPSYVAYVVSFITIGIIWANHHTVMRQISHVDRTFLVLNTLFLLVIAFIPFPTRLLAEYILKPEDAQAAAIAYGITGTLVAVTFNLLWRYAANGRRLLRSDASPKAVEGISRSYLPGPFLYAAATALALINPYASAGVYAAIAIFYVIESSFFGRASPETG